MISCAYCGGEHPRPADVKDCWRRQQTAGSGGPSVDVDAAGAGRGRRARDGVDTPAIPSVDAAGIGRGPHQLGRHALVGPGQDTPPGWEGARRIRVGAQPVAEELAVLRALAEESLGCVIELEPGSVPAAPRPPTPIDDRSPWELGPGFGFDDVALHHLVWSNAIDRRAGATWSLLDAAVALGATVVADGEGDIEVDGGRAWLDGGPVRHRAPIDGVGVVHAVQIEHGRTAVWGPNVVDADLAEDQLAAVTDPNGVARIIAPAGSGKTRVLTERARHLARTWGVPPAAMCLVAFNKRAQEEMTERLHDVPGVQIRTLNSIALAIVNGTAPFAPQPRRWATIDEPDVRRLLQRHVSTRRRRNTDPLAPWIDALSLVRLGLVDPVEVERRYGGDVDGLPAVMPAFAADLERAGQVDFDGQIDRALRVLLTDHRARRVAQRACRLMLVDEFQDLTPAHLLLIRLLAAPGGAVFGVGDDDQTIYGYNGADPAWLIDYRRWFPGATDRRLEVNYRSRPDVVAIADRLLRHNRRRVDKTIRAAAPAVEGDDPSWRIEVEHDSVSATVAAIETAISSGAEPGDVAVLTRVNAVIAPVQIALGLAGLPIASGVGTEFADRTAVRAALAWLRLATAARLDADALAEALRRPSRSVHPRIAEWVAEQRDVRALIALSERLTNERDAERVRDFATDIDRVRSAAAGGATTAQLVDLLVDEIGLGGAVATLDATRRGMNRAAQGDDLLAVRQLARLRPSPDGFGGWLRERLVQRRSPDGVTLATVHRVKGQEWPVVVVHQAEADQYPHRLAEDVEEERRLFHVAITRAIDRLVVVHGAAPSPFVAELTTEPGDLEVRAVAHAAPSGPAPRRSRRSADRDHPLLSSGTVGAAVGLALVDQGHEWTVVDIEPTAVVAERAGATRRFGIGEKVETAGRQRGALAALPGEIAPASAVAFDRLRSWRDVARDGKPAYVVFDDKTLAAIATGLPLDLAALAAIRGVGPAKLEQYGDDVLALVSDVCDP